MNRTVLPLIAVSLIALVAFSGCIFPDVDAINKVKENPAAVDFVADHPNAQLTVALWSESDSKNNMVELVGKCGNQISPTDYYYITFTEGDAKLEAWVYQKTMNVACIYRNDDQCSKDIDCEDGFLCTINKCEGIPKRCTSVRIRECIGGDGCCPQGCTFAVDFDCALDECSTHLDCDNENPATEDFCLGQPKKCVHEYTTECIDGDGYCPPGCNYSSDSDCNIKECITGSDCNDRNPATIDFCEGGICVHQEITQCINEDGYCPARCTYTTDTDCIAQPGNYERFIVNCNGYTTNIDATLELVGESLVTSFNGMANYSNNGGLKFYNFKKYKWNGLELVGYGSAMAERIIIQGRAIFDKEEGISYFYFNKNGLRYEVEFTSGIPATQMPTNIYPFVSGNNDKVPVIMFGTDSLLTLADQNTDKVQILSNYIERSVGPNKVVENLIGKNTLKHSLRLVRCESESAVFSLYHEGNLVTSQTASAGDILFPDLLKKVIRVNYLNRNEVTGGCTYRYAQGEYIETFINGEEFPTNEAKVSPWESMVTFENNRVKMISLNNYEVPFAGPMKAGESIWLIQEGESEATGFCKITFYGLVR